MLFHATGEFVCLREVHTIIFRFRYYEWLKKGKERVPHFTKRKDGKPLLLAGLYDSVVLEGTCIYACYRIQRNLIAQGKRTRYSRLQL